MKRTIITLALLFSFACLFANAVSEINVISREEGSGTRGAFVELTGVEQKVDGVKKDLTVLSSEIANSTSVVITSVQGNRNAIGYISLGSLSDKVKAVSVDGVVPSTTSVRNGSYPIARPFNIAFRNLNEVSEDFLQFLDSSNGQDVISANGYVGVGNGGSYESKGVSGKLTISGSSSVYPLMEKLVEKYLLLNQKVQITLLQSDSTTGMNDVINGTSDIGMASRDLKASELESGLRYLSIAMDGIAIIVNAQNPVNELSKDQIREIYLGNIKNWEDLK